MVHVEKNDTSRDADSTAGTEGPPSGPLYAGRYVLGPLLGRGGTCCVYRAWDTQVQRYVALKRLEPPLSEDERARARFRREGRAIAKLSHPSIVTLLDQGSTEDEEYLVFEYVEGQSLKEFIASQGPLPPKVAGQIIGQIAEGLAHVHMSGLVHRDVKPQNILLDSELRARLTDFGIAIGPDWTRVTRAGAVIGSTRYMSPEQIQGRPIDGRSDLYALGLVFYEMLAGRPAFDGTTVAEIGRKQLREKPSPLRELRPDVPEALERVVMRCLEKLPENRFQSMDELVGALVGLDLYQPQRGSTGLLDFLLGSPDYSLSHSLEWEPPEEARLPLPPGVRRRQKRAVRRAGRPLWRDRKRVLGVAAVVIVLGAIALTLGLTLGKSAVAPDIVGLSLDDARDAAARAGYKLEVANQIIAMDGSVGIVTAQDPKHGAKVADKKLKATVTRAPLPVKVTRLTDVDPEGDAEENPTLLPNMVDGDTKTAWTTERYKSSDFNGIKSGVGFAFELEQPATVVRILSSGDRWKGLLLAPEQAGGQLKEVAKIGGKANMLVELPRPITSGRIWITKLDKSADGSFGVGFYEIEFFR